jgi:molecular chaperone GrpE
MTGKPDIKEAADTVREGAPHGAPEADERFVPAGDPEAPVGPVASPKSESAAAQPGATSVHQPGGTPAEAAEDHERQLEHDLEELTAKAEKADEYLELAQRTRADFENYRRRAAREAAAAQERGIARLAKELLPAVDNLDRALQAAQAVTAGSETNAGSRADDGTDTLVSGIKLVHDDVVAALARAGIEGFSPQGERFDPQRHEAIAQQPVDGAEPGTVVEVYQRGYRLGDVVIRPARVVVAA